VAQETLANIITRGGAKHVEMVIEAENDGYAMTIGDDGAPMDVNLARSMPSARHRMQSAGGIVAAEARPQGNQIRVFVPKSA
jgi:signal transduction histidine kinase